MVLISACAPILAALPSTTAPPAPTPGDTSQIAASPSPSATGPPPTRTPSACGDPFEGKDPRFDPSAWPGTDFCQHSVPFSEIFGAGPLSADSIPAIDEPFFESVAAADGWLGDRWPVMLFREGDTARAYPIAILIWHEIVNDVIDGRPVAITFCPLCNSTLVFDRRLADGRLLDFGTTGTLRNADLVMYDRQTFSWWQQFTGKAIVGEMTGTQLGILPSQIIAWGDFRARFPEGRVLSRKTGFERDYGRNPYVGYDDISSSPFYPVESTDERLPVKERVAAVEVDGEYAAYPFSALRKAQVINDIVGEWPIVVFWQDGTGSALNSRRMDYGREVGSSAVYLREVADQALTFEHVEGAFQDVETGSRWNLFGEAINGPLEGQALTPVLYGEYFWFAWSAFQPETRVWSPPD